MDYQRIYNQIIERAQNRNIIGYSEKHHIIPKCLNGDDSKTNIVKLTAREHFICHLLLCNIYPDNDKLIYAAWAMANKQSNPNQKRVYTVSSRMYEFLKIEAAKHRKNIKLPNRTGIKLGPKPKNFKHVCQKCNNEYLGCDVRGSICYECKEKIEIQCQCGCGKLIKKAKWKCDLNPYWINHQKKGKTYQEIYKNSEVNCGFKKGELNVMADPDMREKQKKGIRSSYTDELIELRRQTKVLYWENKKNKYDDSRQIP